jgi:hypothetical protein
MYRYSSNSKQTSFRDSSPLSNDVIRHYAPSVLAEAAHESRGERYTYIPTIKVIDSLRSEGFQPYEVRQTRCRDAGRREHTKHLVRLRHESVAINDKQEVGEIILINSHDGTSSYQILSGFFRFICSNGLIAGDICNDVRVRHSGNVIDDVIEGSYEVLGNLQEIEHRIADYKSITLSPEEQLLLADESIKLRWDEQNLPIAASQLLHPRRYGDANADLWGTFNRIQESLLRGGNTGRSQAGRRLRTREVTGVTESVKLNKALWSLTEKFAQLKQAA